MKIERRSPRTGQINVMDIPVTEDQLIAWQNGAMVQDAMPNLNDDQREFIMTGYTAEDWEAIFGVQEEESFPVRGEDPAF